MIEAGKTLQNRYRIDKQIGQGGMGAVYVATDERFGSTVAIKQTLCMDDNYRKAIEREARLLNSLKHTALPRVSDHFLEDNGQFLVMEFIPGEDLCCILEENGKPFDPGQVMEWADQLLDALDFLHNQKDPVIHRDIKPQNLKVTPTGQIILLDFGLAKGNPTESNNKTAAKSIFGYSRNYASLEQIQGTGTDPRSDLYSLAATLYHLVAGTAPEDALTRAMAVLSQKPDSLVPAHMVHPAVSKGFSAVLQNALDLNADLRPASAAEMREMIRDHEKYAALAAVRATASNVPDLGVFAQKTKLMPEATQHEAHRSTEAKTAIMPENLSQMTALRSAYDGDTTETPGSARRFALAAGGLTALLAAGLTVGAIYVYSPIPGDGTLSIEGVNAPAESLAVEKLEDNVDAANTEAEVDTPVTVNSGASQESEPPDYRTSATEPKKPSTATRSEGETAAGPTRRVIQTPDGDIVIEGDTVYMNGRKIRGNRIEGPEGTVELNEPPIPPTVFQMDREFPANAQHMTPEQRRRLFRALRQIDANIKVQPPKVKPSKPQ